MKIYSTTVSGSIIWIIILSMLGVMFYFGNKNVQHIMSADKINYPNFQTIAYPWMIFAFVFFPLFSHHILVSWRFQIIIPIVFAFFLHSYLFIFLLTVPYKLPTYVYIIGFYVPFGILCLTVILATYFLTTDINFMEMITSYLYYFRNKRYEVYKEKYPYLSDKEITNMNIKNRIIYENDIYI